MKSYITILLILLPLAALRSETGKLKQGTQAIPFDQLGAEAQKKYAGDGISIVPTKNGAKLKAVMQDLEAEATPEGLWLTSTADEDAGKPNRFRVRAMAITRHSLRESAQFTFPLAAAGVVRATDTAAVFIRPGLVEEYSVSTDGVRQDFVLPKRPPGEGKLGVELAVTGARVEPATYGAKLIVLATGRELAYSRLKVSDATGKELTARLEVNASNRLRVTVEDAGATYPVRIDPTFSDADWISMGSVPGVGGPVYAIAFDGAGNLYVGGAFAAAGSVIANNIAKWDGTSWSALGSGTNNIVRAIAAIGSDIYVGGDFTAASGASANYIAKWSGGSWSAMGSGMNGAVSALAASGATLYAGGAFTLANGVSASRIARFDGTNWSALGSGTNGPVRALLLSGTDLYAGGEFTAAGGIQSSRLIAKWNGSAWSALGYGLDGPPSPSDPPSVNALATLGSVVFAGGKFGSAYNVLANNIAAWTGSVWYALGSGTSSPVRALAVRAGILYVGGDFGSLGWNGVNWLSLASTNGKIHAFATSGSDLYAGGEFFQVFTGGAVIGANRIAKWSGSAWSALGSGTDGAILSFGMSGNDLYVGGSFTSLAGSPANYIARWSGSTWSPLGSGMNGPVLALAVIGSDLYAAGGFTTAGGVSANRIAKWNGSNWSACESGMNSTVLALGVSGSDLYTGGSFTTAGSVNANRVAKWDGVSWSALGSGMSGDVWSFAAIGSDLYAGGNFSMAGGLPANNIAKWNGHSWSAVGSGMNASVLALAASGSGLYAGGSFTTAGGTPANCIARWNGSTWAALGSGMNAYSIVSALAVNGSDLYAAGDFTTAGGLSAASIAKWNGSAWAALGSGITGGSPGLFRVKALKLIGAELYAGGWFTVAGGKVSAYVARASLGAAATALASWRTAHSLPTDGLQDLANPSGDGVANLLKFAFNMAPNPGDLAVANVGILPENGTAGLPFIAPDTQGLLIIEFIRLKSATNPGITYLVETGEHLNSLAPLDLSAAAVVSIDPDWERVTVADPTITPNRFGRVRVAVFP